MSPGSNAQLYAEPGHLKDVPGTAKTGRPETATAEAAYHERGRAIYNFRCYFCHGYSGDARTLASSFLIPKPRNFVIADPTGLSRESMILSVTHGREKTAMKSFASTIDAGEIAAVVDFVRKEFMVARAKNTRYHTVANGWPDHQRYASAFPFALGEIALDTLESLLSKSQQAGKRLFMSSCITCHDRGRVNEDGVVWDARAVSYPRNEITPIILAQTKPQSKTVDTMSAATPYAVHDISPDIQDLNVTERKGETLFQSNCALCHAADGTGKNWIGSFLEPHPRNLTDKIFMRTMSRAKMRRVIRDGLPGTPMSAWKDVLSTAQIDNIIDYIHRAFHPVRE